jgi:hypothetical protein
MNTDENHEPEVNEEMKKLLDSNAHNWLREDLPTLYALVKSEVEAGRPKADILNGCRRIKKVNETILNSIEMAIDHLEREAKR